MGRSNSGSAGTRNDREMKEGTLDLTGGREYFKKGKRKGKQGAIVKKKRAGVLSSKGG